ncbi:hypothetical protein [Pedobacter rhodius]|uniref:Entericidin n=1 Tax=Pedobacter rhodius TaxID=3004098 RepID=A0ABT4KSJ4_9SPHI|nr:hypothetical protein [Pedobacter sp. SJ11]MCZ4221903.1 hypothetical protein [Pedobacter sp. SJ11]
MKKLILIFVTAISINLIACSGNRADGKNESGKDTITGHADSSTNLADTTASESIKTDTVKDSTSNAPKLPGN